MNFEIDSGSSVAVISKEYNTLQLNTVKQLIRNVWWLKNKSNWILFSKSQYLEKVKY